MVPCLEFGSIKLRCLKPTKKQFPSSICAVYWLFYRQCKQPLRYLNKNRPVVSQLILYCQGGLQLEAGDAATLCCVFTADFVLIQCFFCKCIPSLSCTIMSFLFKFKKHNQWFNIQSLICQTSCLLSVLDKMIQPLRISWKYFCWNNLIPAALKISSTWSVVLRSWATQVRFEHQLQSFQLDWQHSAGWVFRS